MEPGRTRAYRRGWLYFFSYRAGVRMNTYIRKLMRVPLHGLQLKSNAEDYIKLNVYAILTLQYIYTIVGKIYYSPHPDWCAPFHVLITQYNDDMDDERRREKRKFQFTHFENLPPPPSEKNRRRDDDDSKKNQKTNWIIIYWVDSILELKFGLLLNRYIHNTNFGFLLLKCKLLYITLNEFVIG